MTVASRHTKLSTGDVLKPAKQSCFNYHHSVASGHSLADILPSPLERFQSTSILLEVTLRSLESMRADRDPSKSFCPHNGSSGRRFRVGWDSLRFYYGFASASCLYYYYDLCWYLYFTFIWACVVLFEVVTGTITNLLELLFRLSMLSIIIRDLKKLVEVFVSDPWRFFAMIRRYEDAPRSRRKILGLLIH